MNSKEPIPSNPPGAEYWEDAHGRLVPIGTIKPIDRTRNDLVTDLFTRAQNLSRLITTFKAGAFADIAAFVDLSAGEYGVKLGGTKGNVTLVSFDGRYKVQRAMQETITFDERLQAAKKLIDECIQSWGAGSDDKIKVLVNDAFQVNKEGQVNTGRVLGLRRHNFTDEKWQRAMQAISDSVQTACSKSYLRFYERSGDSDEYKPLSLDVASA